ncbi:VanZ family protein [Paenibacillus sp. GCM10012307]|uniref:VanZ family protein n=1 Tax=Paenibacillus roseus TaxID=2798579 RepID=A0A934JAG8_9BACL|nr:VanZ family protein [Paenibacillus roseus]MBJ6363260.1 VanZ family protein [Paenibacillus roseus]
MIKTDYRPIGLRRMLRWLPALIWMGVIFWLSSRTGEQLGSVLPIFKYILPWMESFDWGHFVAYFVLALAMDYGFGSKADAWRMKLLIVFLCFLYGVTDEFHQFFVDDRTPDMMDLRNDAIGAALAMLAIKIPFIRRMWRKVAP